MKTKIKYATKIEYIINRIKEIKKTEPELQKNDVWVILKDEIKLKFYLYETGMGEDGDFPGKIFRSNLFLEIRKSYFNSAWEMYTKEEEIEELEV